MSKNDYQPKPGSTFAENHPFAAWYDGERLGYFTNPQCAAHSVAAQPRVNRNPAFSGVVRRAGPKDQGISLAECRQMWAGRI